MVSRIFSHHLKSYPPWVVVLEESLEGFWKGDLVNIRTAKGQQGFEFSPPHISFNQFLTGANSFFFHGLYPAEYCKHVDSFHKHMNKTHMCFVFKTFLISFSTA